MTLAAMLAACDRAPLSGGNVLLITVDTLRADRVGAYGSHVHTPGMDRLATEGVLFSQAFSVAPTTLAAHASMFTGRYPRDVGVVRNGFALGEAQETVAEIFQREGRRTAAFISSYAVDPRWGLAQGFEEYDAQYGVHEALDQDWRPASQTIDAALNWLRDHDGEESFVWVHLFEPHFPYEPPPPFDTLYALDPDVAIDGSMETILSVWSGERVLTDAEAQRITALYEGEIAWLDVEISRLLDHLAGDGRLENTWVVLASDHGESLGEHDYWFDHGKHLYDTDLRVPLLIRPPDGLEGAPRGKTIETTVRTMDLAPTLLDLGGVTFDAQVPAASLLPCLLGRGSCLDRPLWAEATKPHRVEATRGWPNAPKAHAVRADGWKLIRTPYLARVELYDVVADPAEETSLSNSPGAQVERDRLESQMGEWRTRPTAAPERPDSEQLRRLRALGYID